MSTILITGGTGLIGTALTGKLVAGGHDVIIISRTSQTSDDKKITYATWDVQKQTIDAKAIEKADYIIHLAGAGVADKRWSEERKKEIVESRTQSSKLLIKAISETPNNIKAVISASAIGFYGADIKPLKKGGFTEDAPPDKSFVGETCRLWEESIRPVERLGVRLVILRLGIVLSKNGGALAQFMKPMHFGIAGILASGKQTISWIHIEDLCNLFIFAIHTNTLHGTYNAVAPMPVTNKQLTLTLAEKMRGKFYVPMHVPALVLKLMLGEMSVEVLKSATISSFKVQAAGFHFSYNSIDTALTNLVNEA